MTILADQWLKAYKHREKIESLLAEIWEDRQESISNYEMLEILARVRNLTFRIEKELYQK